MGKVDCIAEMCEEQFNAGLTRVAINMLSMGFSIIDVCKATELSIEKINDLEKEIKSSK